MSIPLTTILTAAPGIIATAADIIKLIRNRKQSDEQKALTTEQLDEVVTLLEKQAQVIEELAKQNGELALAVRNNRILTITATVVAGLAIIIAMAL